MPLKPTGRNKEFKTFIPFLPYSYRIYVIFTDSLVESANALFEKGLLTKNHGIDDTTDGFSVRMPNQSYSFVVLKYNASINQIVHECYHAVCNMFRWVSAEHEEELFAYHMGYLVREVCRDQEKVQKKLDKMVESVVV